MKTIENADDFKQEFSNLVTQHETIYNPIYEEIRRKFQVKYASSSQAQSTISKKVDVALEAQIRAMFLDPLLKALNWNVTYNPDESQVLSEVQLLVEPPSKSVVDKWIYFDYLGVEKINDSLTPLLLFEAKKPECSLPNHLNLMVRNSDFLRLEKDLQLVEIIINGIKDASESTVGKRINGEWKDYTYQLYGYVRSIHARTGEFPKKVAISNGDWLVIFTSPEEVFNGSASNPIQHGHVLVFTDRKDIIQRANVLFLHLNYFSLVEKPFEVSVADLSFRGPFSAAIQGLMVMRFAEPNLPKLNRVRVDSIAKIKIDPIIYLKSTHGSWCFTREDQPLILPDDLAHLQAHLHEVKVAFDGFLSRIRTIVGDTINIISLDELYRGKDFKFVKGVTRYLDEENIFLVTTGNCSHFINFQPTKTNCETEMWFHWDRCPSSFRQPTPGPIMKSSFEKKSLFFSGQCNHCAHSATFDVKKNQITPQNIKECGARSRDIGSAFCEIWEFEQYLCCRTCVFQTVCSKSTHFQLPCQPIVP